MRDRETPNGTEKSFNIVKIYKHKKNDTTLYNLNVVGSNSAPVMRKEL